MASNPIPLLPCPWCGSEEVELGWDDYNDGPVVHCKKCCAQGPCFDQSKFEKHEELAIAAWNKGPYADRFEIHAKALTAHAGELKAKAAEHLAKADELMAKAGKGVA